MQQVADWLERLGLGQYAQRFAENDISYAVLPDLTDQDLKDIGVSLGHRRQLLRAIAELPSSAKAAAATAACGASQDTAERRQVTVMFSDLVGAKPYALEFSNNADVICLLLGDINTATQFEDDHERRLVFPPRRLRDEG
jgi:hypothetical protein